MRTVLLIAVVALAGCHLVPPELPAPSPAPPAGDTLMLFGEDVPATADAVRAAFTRRFPPGSFDLARMTADGLTLVQKERREKTTVYTVALPVLLTSRWGLVQTVRVRLTEAGGPDDVFLLEAKRLPESAILEACPDLRRLPGLSRADGEAVLRANGFHVRDSPTQLFARRWSAEPSAHAAAAVLIAHVENGRIAALVPATLDHPSRGFDGLVGLFPARGAPAVEQAKAYAKLPFTLAGLFGLGVLQWAALPLAL